MDKENKQNAGCGCSSNGGKKLIKKPKTKKTQPKKPKAKKH